jgi:hypothetical protein
MNARSIPSLVLILFIVPLGVGFSQNVPELELLRAKNAGAHARLDEPVEAWNFKYIAQLKKVETALKTKGDLDQLLAVQAEIKQPGKQSVSDKHRILAQVRGIYDKQMSGLQHTRERGYESVAREYRNELAQLQHYFTQQGKPEAVSEVSKEIALLGTRGMGEKNGSNQSPPVSNSAKTTDPVLLAYWKLDGNGREESPTQLSGRVIGQRAFGPGIHGQALQTGNGRRIAIPSLEKLNLTPPFSLTIWVKLMPETDQPPWATLLGFTGSSDGLRIQTSGDQSGQLCVGLSSGRPDVTTVGTAYNDGAWHHLALRVDHHKVSLHVDGFLEGEKSFNGSVDVGRGDGGFSLGVNPDKAAQEATAWLDELRIYKGLLPLEVMRKMGTRPNTGVARANPNRIWRNLMKEDFSHAEGGNYFWTYLNVESKNSERQGGGGVLPSPVPKDTLIMHADGRLDYTFKKPITEFRATAFHGHKTLGNGVIFKVLADDRTVYTSGTVDPGGSKEVQVTMRPTLKLSLVTDSIKGDIVADHTGWVKPEYR